MNLRISRRTLRLISRSLLGVFFLCGVTMGVYLVGLQITPRTVGQRPILYSPAVRAAIDYRTHVAAWLSTIDQIDRQVARLIDETSSERNGDLYDQSVRVEELIDQSVRLAQDTTLISAPAALSDLRQQVIAVSLTYVTAGQAVSILINAPTGESRSAAQAALAAARQALETVHSSRWFTQPTAKVMP